ncbi:hypothetical protein BC567DRAFT_214915 [Phyllosticta citribraziliensis]
MVTIIPILSLATEVETSWPPGPASTLKLDIDVRPSTPSSLQLWVLDRQPQVWYIASPITLGAGDTAIIVKGHLSDKIKGMNGARLCAGKHFSAQEHDKRTASHFQIK